MAVAKFFHTVLSSWILGAVFVVGISCWYLLRNRQKEFALSSIKVAAAVGPVSYTHLNSTEEHNCAARIGPG